MKNKNSHNTIYVAIIGRQQRYKLITSYKKLTEN